MTCLHAVSGEDLVGFLESSVWVCSAPAAVCGSELSQSTSVSVNRNPDMFQFTLWACRLPGQSTGESPSPPDSPECLKRVQV